MRVRNRSGRRAETEVSYGICTATEVRDARRAGAVDEAPEEGHQAPMEGLEGEASERKRWWGGL